MTKLDEFMAQMQVFNEHIEALGLLNVHELEPILSFKELCELYEMENPGRATKSLMSELVGFQMLNREASKDLAKAFLLSHKAEFLEGYLDEPVPAKDNPVRDIQE